MVGTPALKDIPENANRASVIKYEQRCLNFFFLCNIAFLNEKRYFEFPPILNWGMFTAKYEV